MDERRMLELAAKAAGMRALAYTWDKGAPWGEHHGFTIEGEGPDEWNPRHDDGAALQLAVKLRLLINISSAHTEVRWYDETLSETHVLEQWDNGMSPAERTRLAIVRAAARIGEAMDA